MQAHKVKRIDHARGAVGSALQKTWHGRLVASFQIEFLFVVITNTISSSSTMSMLNKARLAVLFALCLMATDVMAHQHQHQHQLHQRAHDHHPLVEPLGKKPFGPMDGSHRPDRRSDEPAQKRFYTLQPNQQLDIALEEQRAVALKFDGLEKNAGVLYIVRTGSQHEKAPLKVVGMGTKRNEVTATTSSYTVMKTTMILPFVLMSKHGDMHLSLLLCEKDKPCSPPSPRTCNNGTASSIVNACICEPGLYGANCSNVYPNTTTRVVVVYRSTWYNSALRVVAVGAEILLFVVAGSMVVTLFVAVSYALICVVNRHCTVQGMAAMAKSEEEQGLMSISIKSSDSDSESESDKKNPSAPPAAAVLTTAPHPPPYGVVVLPAPAGSVPQAAYPAPNALEMSVYPAAYGSGPRPVVVYPQQQAQATLYPQLQGPNNN